MKIYKEEKIFNRFCIATIKTFVSASASASAGNKWSQIWKLLLIKSVKSPREKIVFILANLGLINQSSLSQSSQDFYGICTTIRTGRELVCLPYAGIFSV